MSLPTPTLDDRRFQDIVDHAKSLIPQYCPEWTDHNVSDPGVTLIELFAWMTEMLLYRVNQVPDKMYIHFLDLIGVRLEPPQPARAPITFYLSAPQEHPVLIPEGTEVATVRTQTSQAILFTTETELEIRPPLLQGVFSRYVHAGDAGWVTHDLRTLQLPGQSLVLFQPRAPAPGDAFYLALGADLSHHVLALIATSEIAGGQGVDPENPPLIWEVWQGRAARWVPCEVERDETGGFNYEHGEILLHLPAMVRDTLQGVKAWWLRCRLTEAQASRTGYKLSPELEALELKSRGATAWARQAVTVRDEALGQSDGSSGQRFKLLHAPLLARDLERDQLIVEPPGGQAELWTEARDFADSGPEDRHFVLESSDGALTLGPALIQPDGTLYRFGRTPPKGSRLRFQRYQHGGGVQGNLPPRTLTILKSSIPYIARVTNRRGAFGGRDMQSLEDAKLRAPQVLRTLFRAVTADDYDYLACQVPGVARAFCSAPGDQSQATGGPPPGRVRVAVLPMVPEPEGYIEPIDLALSSALRDEVQTWLDRRRPIGITLEVHPPRLMWIAIQAKLHLPDGSAPEAMREMQEEAERVLYRYLNPLVGGPDGRGWPFGRDLYISEIFALLQGISGVEFVEDVSARVSERPGEAGQVAPPRMLIQDDVLVCSDRHLITLS